MKAIDEVGGQRRRLVLGGGGNGVVEVRWFAAGQSGCRSGTARASFIARLMN